MIKANLITPQVLYILRNLNTFPLFDHFQSSMSSWLIFSSPPRLPLLAFTSEYSYFLHLLLKISALVKSSESFSLLPSPTQLQYKIFLARRDSFGEYLFNSVKQKIDQQSLHSILCRKGFFVGASWNLSLFFSLPSLYQYLCACVWMCARLCWEYLSTKQLKTEK